MVGFVDQAQIVGQQAAIGRIVQLGRAGRFAVSGHIQVVLRPGDNVAGENISLGGHIPRCAALFAGGQCFEQRGQQLFFEVRRQVGIFEGPDFLL